ncbi:Der1-like family-domain-containing protein [Kickxella alabastrina]|uniref:Der1-like family-domain-containing protein n=1 Tax=Kickxella alabastrina TaxID=61397 RepID=UPI0022206469|nr:Der1-like family-domain-containing protein [Kickxella alabastrina]KAI7830128.1 Der1-like family-domain-containing protein [Kickxella alabastrina]
MPSPLEDWYLRIPICTRVYLTSIVAVTLAVQLDWFTPHQLLYTPTYTFSRGEYWRLLTTFLYLGRFSLDMFLNMYFIIQYCRDLEEGSYLTRPADFAYHMVLLGVTLLVVGPIVGAYFLSHMFVTALTYIWSRYHAHIFINFMGLITVPAAYFPWAMVAFLLVVEGAWPVNECVAMGVGHCLWFLADEWPKRPESGGKTLISAPAVLCRWLGQDLPRNETDDDDDAAVVEEPLPAYAEPNHQRNEDVNVAQDNIDDDDDNRTLLRRRAPALNTQDHN